MLEDVLKKSIKIMKNPNVLKEAFMTFNFDRFTFDMPTVLKKDAKAKPNKTDAVKTAKTVSNTEANSKQNSDIDDDDK